MRWAGHVAQMGEKRNAYRLVGKRPLGRGVRMITSPPSVNNVGSLTSHNSIGLHALLWGKLYSYFFTLFSTTEADILLWNYLYLSTTQ
jgi:hypothetical protein